MNATRTLWVISACLALVLPVLSEQVIFTEIHYNPPTGKSEFIELTNNTATPFDISRWTISEGVNFTFPEFSEADPRAAFLKNFETVILTGVTEAEFRTAYPTTPEEVRVFGPWTGQLNNGGERISLEDKNGVVTATVRYDNRGKWPVAADGAGHTLEVINSNRGNDDYRNWKASARRGGTPGVASSESSSSDIPLNLPGQDLEPIPYVGFGSQWKFDDSNTDLGSGWVAMDFDDSGWESGPGLFGFERDTLPEPGLQTDLNRDVSGGLATYYFRAEFDFGLGIDGSQIVIDQVVDDGVVYYLNGVEIGRFNMPAGTISHNTVAADGITNAELVPAVIKLDGTSYLREGRNVFAVSLHNEKTGSSDVVFGAKLSIAAPSPSVVINEVFASGAGEGYIEFYNPLEAAVSLEGHYLSDDLNNLKKSPIGAGVSAEAGGLATVGYTESGFTAGEKLTVFLTAPDGTTILNAVDATIPTGSSWGRKPNGSDNVFILAAPTRNAANASLDDIAEVVSISEVQFTKENKTEWVEVHNSSPSALGVDGLFVASKLDFSDRVALEGTIPAGGFLSVDAALGDGMKADAPLLLVTDGGVVLGGKRFGLTGAPTNFQNHSAAPNEFYHTAVATRDAKNAPDRNTSIVINEIMYDLPSDHRGGEYVELFNNGETPVDAGGWQFTQGAGFEFPSGTTIAPGAYIVVSADAARFRSIYPGVNVLGDFTGQLSDRGELLRIETADGDLVDEVHYLPEGDWPELADGDGSSMELKHPDMDNSLPTAWEDSDESNKSQMERFVITGEYGRVSPGQSSNDTELHFHLVGDAYAILENISVTKNGDPSNLIENVDEESSGSNSGQGWVSQGTHWASFVKEGQLHLIADGHGDNKSNRSEIDIERPANGDDLKIEFDARWVHGKPRLVCQTWNHAVGLPVLLSVPDNLGTPGQANSTALESPAPVVSSLLHSPPVPKPDESVVVTATVQSVDSLASVEAVYRLDSRNGDGDWARINMFDHGLAGDDVAADGIYSARVPEYRDDGDIIEFYVEAKAQSGQVSTLPKLGADRPGMWIVDANTPESDLLLQRFIVSARSLDALGNAGGGSKFQAKFPRMANHYFNMTFIANEREIYYNGEIRKSGSPFTREGGSSLSHGKWRLPGDRLFRDRRKSVIDPSLDMNDRMARFFLYQLGHPINENEFVEVMINDGRPATKEDMEPIATDFISRNFVDGSKGTLLRIDDEWFFGDGGSGGSRNADWGYKDSDNPIRYQSEWLMRSQETRYDYTSFVELLRTLDDRNFSANEIDRMMDRDLNCINAAVRGYDADWDTLTLNRGKNGYFYRKPDGLWMLLHWDGDRTFGNTGEVIIGGLRGVRTYFQHDAIRRTLNYYLTELLTQHTNGSVRTETWLDLEEDASTNYRASKSKFTRWFTGRERAAENYIRAPFDEDFAITGGDAETAESSIAISGTSPSSVYTIQVDGHPEAQVEWESTTEWTISNILLGEGQNVLKVTGVNHEGLLREQAEFTAIKTTGAAPIASLVSTPRSMRLSVSEELLLDASASFDPDGDAVVFEWTPPGGTASFATEDNGSKARVTFPVPGVYKFELSLKDSAGNVSVIRPEVSVYGEDGFSSFNDVTLGQFWTPKDVTEIANFSPSAWYSLTEQPGRLTIQVIDDSAKSRAFLPPELPEPVVVFDLDAEWSYDDSNTDFGDAWTAPGFDDSGWPIGMGMFGFESSELAEPIRTTFRRDSAGGLLTYYLRKEFAFDRDPVGSEIIIDHFLDDGVVYYLNGREIGRAGLPAGEITHTTQATGSTSNAALTAQAVTADGTGVLQEGVNVIAAELHNEKAGSSDAVLGTRLKIAAVPKSGEVSSLDGVVHPWIPRPISDSGDWTLETKLTLETLQLGDFLTGLQVETKQGGNEIRYAVGYDNGTSISAFLISATAGASRLASVDFDASSTVAVRIARRGNDIVFAWDSGPGWEDFHSAGLAEGSTVVKGGPFVSTEVPVSMQVSFDYVMLSNPGSTRSPLAGSLLLSEIMYHPSETPEPEFLEFFNAHSEPISLNGVTIRARNPFDEFKFGDVTLQAGAFAVLAKDQAVFQARYGNIGNFLGSWGGGSLGNGGERIAIFDASGQVILDFTYDDRAPWPEAADGDGPSLLLIDPASSPDHGQAQNWRSGVAGGTPGRGESAGDATFTAWMAVNGFTDPLADPDGNGLSHLVTFALGADLIALPQSALLNAVSVQSGDGQFPALQFRKRNGTTLNYTIEVSGDLKLWSTGNAVLESETDNGDGTSTVVYRGASVPGKDQLQFMRLRVAIP